MYCIFCGAKNPDNAKFCYSCGRNISALSQAASPWPKPQKPEASVLRQTQAELKEQTMNAHIKDFFYKDRGGSAPEQNGTKETPAARSIGEHSKSESRQAPAISNTDFGGTPAENRNMPQAPSVQVQPKEPPQPSEAVTVRQSASGTAAENPTTNRQSQPSERTSENIKEKGTRPDEEKTAPVQQDSRNSSISACPVASVEEAGSKTERIVREVSEGINIWVHFHAAAKGYDTFEGECVGRANNPVTHIVTYSFAGHSVIRLSGRKMPIVKGQWYRLYLPKGSVDKAESGSRKIREFYGIEPIVPQREGKDTFDR